MFRKKKSLIIGSLLFTTFHMHSCDNKPEQKSTRKPNDYIKPIAGVDDSIPAEVSEKGKVLIAYSDCYTCHKEDHRKGDKTKSI